MWVFIVRRLLLVIPVLLGVSTLAFSLLHFVPGDPVDLMLGEGAQAVDRDLLRARLHLDKPVAEQYLIFMSGLLRGDLQESFTKAQPVTTLIRRHYPRTLVLAVTSLGLAVLFALPLGMLAAVRQGTLADTGTMGLSLIGVSVPSFWLGPMLVLLFAVHLRWLPVAGATSPRHIILPAVTLALGLMALLTRMTRAAVLETIREDYVRTARAKGLDARAVLFKHVLRNACIPIITVIGLQFGGLLAGAVITERIFAWPGIGWLMVDAIFSRDVPVLQGCILVIATTYVLVNLATDVVYALVDPRVKVA